MTGSERELLLRMRRTLEAGANEGVLSGSFSVSSSEYTDSERYARELREVVRRRPLPLVPSASLAEPGARTCKELAGERLLATRDAAGAIHVLENHCRHRGASLVGINDGSRGGRLVCPYHGWTYALDGSLLTIPERETGFPDVALDELSLPRFPSMDLAGMIWTCLDAPGPSSEEFQALREELELLKLSSHRVMDVRRSTHPFNWKLGVNAFLETYHFKVAHKDGIAPHFVWNRILVDAFGENLRLTLPRTSIQAHLATTAEEDWELRPHVTYVYFVFPCSFLSVLPDHASFVTFLPEGIDRTRVESHIYVPEDDRGRTPYWEKNAALFFQTLKEDTALCESIQRGLGRERQFTFAAFEQAIAHFRKSMERIVG